MVNSLKFFINLSTEKASTSGISNRDRFIGGYSQRMGSTVHVKPQERLGGSADSWSLR